MTQKKRFKAFEYQSRFVYSLYHGKDRLSSGLSGRTPGCILTSKRVPGSPGNVRTTARAAWRQWKSHFGELRMGQMP